MTVSDSGSMANLWLRTGPLTASLTKLVDFQMERGRKYAIKLEYFQTSGDAIAHLVWTTDVTKSPIDDAVGAAKKSDVVVAVVGITSDLEGEEMNVQIEGFQGGDRTSLDLPKEEETFWKP